MTLVRIGSRGSALARAQAAWVARRLAAAHPGVKIEFVVIKTSGDRFIDVPLPVVGGKGIFVKEIEEALLRNEIDLAVHSMKDLPTELAAGLTIAAVPEREDPRDVLVSRSGATLKELPPGSKIGTGSPRRRAQVLHYRGDLSLAPIRGNVDTRLEKLDAGQFDALIMAAAGLKRIGRTERIAEFISPDVCLGAVAQGALGIECREGDAAAQAVSCLHDQRAYAEIAAERAFLRRLGGGCQVPIGARAVVEDQALRISGVVADPEGSRVCRGEISGAASAAERLGRELAERLLSRGADAILAPETPGPRTKEANHGPR